MGGVRFLELKVYSDRKSGVVWVYSGDVMCIRLEEVFRQVSSFVMTFSTEIVCLFLTSGSRVVDWSQVCHISDRYFQDRVVTPDMKEMSIGRFIYKF